MTYNYRGSRYGGREGSVPDWRRAPVVSSDWRDLLEDPRATLVDNAVTWLIDKSYLETVGLAPDGDLLLRLTDKAWENDHILDADVRESRDDRPGRIERRPFERPRDDRPRDDRPRDDRPRDDRSRDARQRDRAPRPRFSQGESDFDQGEPRGRYNNDGRNFRGTRPAEDAPSETPQRELPSQRELPPQRELAPLGDASIERAPRPPINRDSPGVRLPPVQRDSTPIAGEIRSDGPGTTGEGPRSVQAEQPRNVSDAPSAPVDVPYTRPVPSESTDAAPANVESASAAEASRSRVAAPRVRAPRAATPVESVVSAPTEPVASAPVNVPVEVPVATGGVPVSNDEVVVPVKAPRASRAKPKDVVEGEEAPAPRPRTRRKAVADEATDSATVVAPSSDE